MNVFKKLLGVLAVSACALILSVPAFARDGVSAEIPFAFVAEGKSFDAGTYTVTTGPVLGSLMLRDAAGHSIVLYGLPAAPTRHDSDGLLLFERDGGEATLAKVWLNCASDGLSVVRKSSGRGKPFEVALFR